ncbi:helix-turn-helix transcriptional regulator [Gordonia sp. DT101]|uniref:helix-turn-helix transcriptional regulator n=1 Tax=Gordonia sp. DT101 TaxID=3416545 RepID=UPI003CE83F00
MNDETPERMTAPQAAKYLGVSKQTLYNLRSAGSGPASYKIGQKLFFDRRDLDLYIARCKAATLVAG